MKYYEQLIDERVFGYPALKEIISENPNTIYSLLREYLQKHYVEQVKKGLYVAVSMETGAPVASRFEIGSFRPFSFDGYQYQCYPERIKLGVLQKENGVKVTDTERTVLDSVNDLEKAGGISELYHCLQMVTFLDEDRLLYYLELYGKQFLYQKVGFILEPLKGNLNLTDHFFDQCREHMGKSKRYFSGTMDRRLMEYVSAWQMYVPKNFKRMAELEE